MSKPVWEDIMKYDGTYPEPPYDVCDSCNELLERAESAEANLTTYKARLEKVLKMLEPGPEPYCTGCSEDDISIKRERREWTKRNDMYVRAVAIMEGRNNE